MFVWSRCRYWKPAWCACKTPLPLSPLTLTSDKRLLKYFRDETWGRVFSCATHPNGAHYYAYTQTTCKSSTAACLSLCQPPLLSHFQSGLSLSRNVQDSRFKSDLFVKTMLGKGKSFYHFPPLHASGLCENKVLHLIHSQLLKMIETPFIFKVMFGEWQFRLSLYSLVFFISR